MTTATERTNENTPRPPYKGAKVSNVAIVVKDFREQFPLSCEFEGARYHVWVRADTLELASDVLYKNPPTKLDRRHPGYFATRQLKASTKFGRWLVHAMREEMRARNLLEQAKEEARRAEEAAARERAQQAFKLRQEQAAGELYDLLTEYVNRFTGDDKALEYRARALLERIENVPRPEPGPFGSDSSSPVG